MAAIASELPVEISVVQGQVSEVSGHLSHTASN